MVSNQTGCQLRVSQIAELPQLLRGTVVLKHDLVHLESIEVANAKSIQRLAYVLDEIGQLGLVILRYSSQGDLPLRPARHSPNVTRPRVDQRALRAMSGRQRPSAEVLSGRAWRHVPETFDRP